MPLKEICGNHKESNAATMEINAPSVPQLAAHHNTPPQGKVLLQIQLIIKMGQKFRTDLQGTTSHLALFLNRECFKAILQHPLILHWIMNSTSIEKEHIYHFLQHPAFEGIPFSLLTRLKTA